MYSFTFRLSTFGPCLIPRRMQDGLCAAPFLADQLAYGFSIRLKPRFGSAATPEWGSPFDGIEEACLAVGMELARLT